MCAYLSEYIRYHVKSVHSGAVFGGITWWNAFFGRWQADGWHRVALLAGIWASEMLVRYVALEISMDPSQKCPREIMVHCFNLGRKPWNGWMVWFCFVMFSGITLKVIPSKLLFRTRMWLPGGSYIWHGGEGTTHSTRLGGQATLLVGPAWMDR